MTPQFTNPLPIQLKSRFMGSARMLAAAAGGLLLFFAVDPHAVAQTPTLFVVRGMPVHAKLTENFLPQQPLTKAEEGASRGLSAPAERVPWAAIDGDSGLLADARFYPWSVRCD